MPNGVAKKHRKNYTIGRSTSDGKQREMKDKNEWGE